MREGGCESMIERFIKSHSFIFYFIFRFCFCFPSFKFILQIFHDHHSQFFLRGFMEKFVDKILSGCKKINLNK